MEKILIIDYGSQYTQLIARRIRELNVYSEIIPYNQKIQSYLTTEVKGIILSGGPASASDEDAPYLPTEILSCKVPILGICYGMQLLVDYFGGQIRSLAKREYGRANISIIGDSPLFQGVNKRTEVWMSHGDDVSTVPSGFNVIARSEDIVAGISNDGNIFGVQFHPEVTHTQEGQLIIKNFLFNICRCQGSWQPKSFIKEAISKIKDTVLPDERVICGLSGGVDSTVTAVLTSMAIGARLTCIFVDNGLLRLNEGKQVLDRLTSSGLNLNVHFVDAKERFLRELQGVIDPEKKRKIIGRVFIEVFEEETKKIPNVSYLAQGTLYPDVIESVSFKGGPSDVIKSHHNVGGLPERMRLKLIEPLRELFKDEVRNIGVELGIDKEMLYRQPFPGPGLAIRIIGEVNEGRLSILREADAIFLEEIRRSGFYHKLWQSFAVLLPIQSVGVMGDARTYEYTIALRAVVSNDGMTADWAYLPKEVLQRSSNRIINEVQGVNRVVFDISSKPPATIEWE